MAKRGRKSSTSVAVLPPVDPAEIESIARPEPPECLDVSARDVWLGVVENLSADWFEPVMFPVLEQYCRHVVEARRLNALIVQAVEKHSFYSPMRLRQEPIAKNYPATPPGGRAGSPAPLRRSRRSTGSTEGEHQPAPRLQRQDEQLLRKGRRTENQSLGIGAFAYYRRVVENQKDSCPSNQAACLLGPAISPSVTLIDIGG